MVPLGPDAYPPGRGRRYYHAAGASWIWDSGAHRPGFGQVARRPSSNELAEPVLEPLVAEARPMPLFHHRAILEQRLAHDR